MPIDYASQILAANDLPLEPLADGIPEWGIGPAELSQRGMSGQERRDFERLFVADPLTGQPPTDDPRAAMVARTLCRADGMRVFAEEQIAALSGKSGAVLDRLYENGARLSGIRSAKEEKEAQKNSSATGGSDSSTG